MQAVPIRVAVCAAAALTFVACAKAVPQPRAPKTDVASVASLKAPSAEAQGKLRGTWVVDLSPEEARLLQIARLAIAPENKDAELKALAPSKGEIDFYENIVSLSQTFDPRIEQIEKQVKDAQLVVTVSEDQVAFQHPGDAKPKTGTFWIEAEREGASGKELDLRIREGDDGPVQMLVVTIVDDDAIMVKREGDEKATRMIRKR